MDAHATKRNATARNSVRAIRRTPGARLALFCFPYAGSGASIFHSWQDGLPAWIDLYGIVYPGRECRAAEPPARELPELVQAVARDIAPLCDQPFAFFGHSMGAYVAFEASRALEPLGLRPVQLFLSAAGAPHLPHPHPIHHLPPAEFLRELIRLNGFPSEVLRDPQLLSYALPLLRADFTACETYRFSARGPVRTSMMVLGGTADPRVDAQHLSAWQQLAAVAFEQRMFQGDHFYLRSQRDPLLRALAQALDWAA